MAQHRLDGQSTVPLAFVGPARAAVARYFRAAPPAVLIFQTGLFLAFFCAVLAVGADGTWTLDSSLAAVGSFGFALAMVGVEVLNQRIVRERAAHDATRLRLANIMHAKPVGAPVIANVMCANGGHRFAFRDGAWEDLGPATHRREAANT